MISYTSTYLKSVKRCDSALRLIRKRNGLLEEARKLEELLLLTRDDLMSYDWERINNGNRTIERILGYSLPLEQILPLKDKKDKPIEERLERSLGVMTDDAKESLKKCKQYRVNQATEDALDAGWYIIMDTLTIEQRFNDRPEQILGGDGWHRYKQRWREKIRFASGHSRTDLQDEYIQYFGAVEFGENGDNPHVHVLWFCKNIPESWKKDPNYGLDIPHKREIDNAKDLWDYGWCTPVAVRSGYDDAWAKCGWTWNTDKHGIPITVTNSKGAGLYICKYMTKENTHKWRTRTRMSRNLGMKNLKNAFKKVSTKHLRPLSELSSLNLWKTKWRDQVRIPTLLITECAKQERLSRAWESKPMLMASKHFQRKSRNICSEISSAVSELPTERHFSVCREWLYDSVKLDTVACDSRATNAIKNLIRELKRFRDEPLLTGFGGRSNATL